MEDPMIILEANSTHQIERSVEKVDFNAQGASQQPGVGSRTQSSNRICERAAKKGARKSMLGWLEKKAIESAIEAGRIFEKTSATAKPKIESVSRTALQAAGDISESVANTLLGMSKKARIAAFRNMPNARIMQLLIGIPSGKAILSQA
jgi:hypothetical protein